MCAVEKVSAMNQGNENHDAQEKTWWNLPERALKGATDSLYTAGKYAWDNMPSWWQKPVEKFDYTDKDYRMATNAMDIEPSWGQKPVEKFDYTDEDYRMATNAMENALGDYGRKATLAQRVEVISNRLGWSNQKAMDFLKEYSLDAEFTKAQLARADQEEVRVARLATLRPNRSPARLQIKSQLNLK